MRNHNEYVITIKQVPRTTFQTSSCLLVAGYEALLSGAKVLA